MFRIIFLLFAVLLFCAHVAESFTFSSIKSGLARARALLGSEASAASDESELEHVQRSTASTEVAFTVMIYANGESTRGMYVIDSDMQ